MASIPISRAFVVLATEHARAVALLPVLADCRRWRAALRASANKRGLPAGTLSYPSFSQAPNPWERSPGPGWLSHAKRRPQGGLDAATASWEMSSRGRRALRSTGLPAGRAWLIWRELTGAGAPVPGGRPQHGARWRARQRRRAAAPP
jgi:hypothetical protein